MRKPSAIASTAVVIALGLTFVVGGCSSDDSSTTSTTNKVDVSKDTTGKNKGFSVETPNGQASISLSGELPPNWPKDFPAPKQSDVAGSGSLVKSSAGGMVGVYTTRQSASDTFEAYKSNSDLDVSDVKSVSPGDVFLGTMKIGGQFQGSITVTSVGGTTYVVVFLGASAGSTGSTTTTASSSTGSSSTTSTASTDTSETTTTAG